METLLLGLTTRPVLFLIGAVLLPVLQLRSTGTGHEQQTAAPEARLAQLAPVDEAVQDIRLRLAELSAQAKGTTAERREE